MSNLGDSIQVSMRAYLDSDDAFGETATHFPIASQTVLTDDEGEESITFDTSSSIDICVVDYDEIVSKEGHGIETYRTAILTVRDNINVQEKDRIVFRSLNWEIETIEPVRMGGNTIAQTVTVVQDRR